MKKHLPLILTIILTGCAVQPTPAVAPTRLPFMVAITPTLTPLGDALQICATALPDSALIVEPIPANALSLEDVALVFRLGEPVEPAAFAAPLAWEQVVLVLHPDNPISALTPEQIKNLFTGRVHNWTELGGNDIEVQVWAEAEGSEIRAAFDAQVMAGGILGPQVHLAPDPAAMLAAVSEERGAVGYLPRAWLTGDVQALDLGIELPVLALANAEPQGPARDLLLCLQGESVQQLLGSRYTPIGSK
ncbi:MAG: substrate-binding domain-containing protein [Anaerolineales bacterium]|nr:substrate-binding domain-containing protein [Anaerolineales bacterium]